MFQFDTNKQDNGCNVKIFGREEDKATKEKDGHAGHTTLTTETTLNSQCKKRVNEEIKATKLTLVFTNANQIT